MMLRGSYPIASGTLEKILEPWKCPDVNIGRYTTEQKKTGCHTEYMQGAFIQHFCLYKDSEALQNYKGTLLYLVPGWPVWSPQLKLCS